MMRKLPGDLPGGGDDQINVFDRQSRLPYSAPALTALGLLTDLTRQQFPSPPPPPGSPGSHPPYAPPR